MSEREEERKKGTEHRRHIGRVHNYSMQTSNIKIKMEIKLEKKKVLLNQYKFWKLEKFSVLKKTYNYDDRTQTERSRDGNIYNRTERQMELLQQTQTSSFFGHTFTYAFRVRMSA